MKHLVLGFAAIALAAPAAAAEVNVWSTNFDDENVFQSTGPFPRASLSLSTIDGIIFASSGTAPGFGTKYLQKSSTEPTTFAASGLGAHTALRLKFDLVFQDSWDSTNGSPAPDILFVDFDGHSYQFTAANASGTVDEFGPGVLVGRGAFLGSIGFFYDRDAVVSYDFLFPHVSSNFALTIRAGGAGWQGGTDESWGIDNFALSAITGVGGGVPEPATWAMMISGFGLVGAAARRRRIAAA
jgi:hypothetical protein